MHVVMLSDLETAGGAAVAASRLADGLVDAGVDVTRVVSKRDGQVHRWKTQELHVEHGLPSRVARRFLSHTLGDELHQQAIRLQLASDLRALQPDIINIHNIHGADWSPEILQTCLEVAPVVWTLHDMWSFTGRCAYNYSCPKFLTGCDADCPTPHEYPALAPDRIHPAWEKRRNLFAAHPEVCAVAPSQWLARTAQSGLWSGHRVEVIPYGLNLETFTPLDRAQSRRELGLTATGPVLLVSAVDITDRRKGMDLLAAAIESLPGERPTLLTMGKGSFSIPGAEVVHLGLITDERRQRYAYSAADLLVHPARADNLPNVLLEAIACGTPALAFDIGGMPDAVRPGVTGWLADEVSAPAMAAALHTALGSVAGGGKLRESCRAVAEAEYGLATQAHRYRTLFAELLAA